MAEEIQISTYGRVVKNIDDYRIVINKGEIDGVKTGQRFLIYEIDKEELRDPETGESLGFLEIVKGTGVVIHLQERIATLQSDKEKVGGRSIIRKQPMTVAQMFSNPLPFNQQEEIIINPSDTIPFENLSIGDYVKPV